MTSHPTKPGHKHTKTYGQLRRVRIMTNRSDLLNVVKKLTEDNSCTVEEACEIAGINFLDYLVACGYFKGSY